jgi:hypothetical protein
MGDSFFPKSIERIGKIQSSHVTSRFEALQQEIEALFRYSKNQTGIGYLVKTTDRNFRRTGSHALPDSVEFETVEDYVTFTGKKKQWKLFLFNFEHIVHTIPSLKNWAFHNCLSLTESTINWTDVLKVCQYFISTPRPNLYIRQLPIEVHTKFIEENIALMQSLLDFLIPDHIRSADQKRFAERYFLKYDEPLIRIRFLDQTGLLEGRLKDISIPLADFKQISFPVENVFIAENKMNFLTLPSLHSAMSIWSGGGFNISQLENIRWLVGKNIFYWGDIDAHGFQILHQLRSYYPEAKSIMMDRRTFDLYNEFTVNGPVNKSETLSLLTDEEAHVYKYLQTLDKKNRLEQEKLPQAYVNQILYSILP